MVNGGDVLARGVVDILLALCHAVDILAQGGELFLRRGIEQQQVLQRLLAAQPVRPGNAEADGAAEVLVEFFVALAVVAQQLFEVGAELLLQAVPDDLELTVVLQQLARDVQAQVGGVHHAAHETQIIRQQRVAVIHDHHARGVELQALFIALAVEVHRPLRGNEQQRLIGHGALDARGDDALRLVEGMGDGLVELLVLLVRHLAARTLPERHHGVDRRHLVHILVLGLFGVAALLDPARRAQHTDGVADVVGIFFHQLIEPIAVEVLGIFLLVRVRLEVHDDVGADAVLLTFGDGVAVRAGGLPAVGGLRAVFLRDDRDLVRDHERGVEAHAELADDVDVLLLLGLLTEFVRAGRGDDAEVVLQLVLVHADAVIAHGQRARVLIHGDLNFEIAAVKTDLVVGQRKVAELVDGVARVGDDLAQEDLLVGVDGVDHQVEQTLGFCLELFLCHNRGISFGDIFVLIIAQNRKGLLSIFEFFRFGCTDVCPAPVRRHKKGRR